VPTIAVRFFVYSDVDSEVKSTDAPEVRERKETNARTRTTMASLRQRMDQAEQNKVSLFVGSICLAAL